MKTTEKRDAMGDELIIAIGLIWGHLSVRQFEEAYALARGCQRVWPEEKKLQVMAIYASVELHQPLDAAARAVLLTADCKEWTDMVIQRATGDEGDENSPDNSHDG